MFQKINEYFEHLPTKKAKKEKESNYKVNLRQK